VNRLATRLVLAALAVAVVAIGTITAGVLVIGAYVFQQLMAAHGESKDAVESMWQSSVVTVVAVAASAAALLSVGLGVFLAWRVSRPLARLGSAARRVADGDYGARVAREGPRELVSVADSFNQMAEALAEQERQRAELVANFAHELRTPLTNLRGYLEAMRDGVMDPSPDVFDSLREEVDRLERLSRALDSLSGDVPPEAEELDLAGAVRATAELARPGFERAGLRLRVELPAGGPLLTRAVPDHLSQVLANLLLNAQRYTPAGGIVTIAAAAEPDSVLVSVSNAEAEIPASDLPHVFERFYRVDKSRDRARGGAGIGLAIVKQLVEQAGGRVGAESDRGATRFWFSLPAAPRRRPAAPASPRAAGPGG
jgi:two-component system, OmpR family, sensor histidine kinase BaeS